MKVLEIIPVRVSTMNTGLVDIVYVERCGFLWLKTRKVKRRAASTVGILWCWLDNDDNLYDITQQIKSNLYELSNDQTVTISKGEIL